MKKSTMSTMNSVVNDLFDRIAREAGNMCKFQKRQTMSAATVRLACKLVMPKEIFDHADTGASTAVKKFEKAMAKWWDFSYESL